MAVLISVLKVLVMISAENNSHMVFVGSDEVAWRNLLHAVTRSKVLLYFVVVK